MYALDKEICQVRKDEELRCQTVGEDFSFTKEIMDKKSFVKLLEMLSWHISLSSIQICARASYLALVFLLMLTRTLRSFSGALHFVSVFLGGTIICEIRFFFLYYFGS